MTRKRILIADDEEVIRTIIRLALGKGYDTTEAADGEEAWQKFSKAANPFDLVVMDLNMPRLDGHTLSERMLARDANVRLVLLTGRLDYTNQSHPMIRVVNKPFENAELVKIVTDLLGVSSGGD